jgi:hypothetical protein
MLGWQHAIYPWRAFDARAGNSSTPLNGTIPSLSVSKIHSVAGQTFCSFEWSKVTSLFGESVDGMAVVLQNLATVPKIWRSAREEETADPLRRTPRQRNILLLPPPVVRVLGNGLLERGIHKCPIAYRKIPASPGKRGKCNNDFALDAFHFGKTPQTFSERRASLGVRAVCGVRAP